jgi:hypothetical protein
MEILTVPIPLQALVERFADIAFPESFADPQAAGRRVVPPALIVKSADPPMAHVVIAISPQDGMDLIDQLRRAAPILLITRPLE